MQSSNEIKTVIEGWIGKNIDNVHTAMPGSVVSYDPGTNRAQVQPSGKFKMDDGRSLSYPIIHNVPVVFPTGCGGTAGVTFPVQKGDGCLLVFAESQLDDFISGGDSGDPRSHDMNDAICIPGLYSGAVPSNVSHSSDVCIFNGDVMMRVGTGGITVTGGDLVVDGISVMNHTHTGCQGGSTGKPK